MSRSQETMIQTGLTAAMMAGPALFGAVHLWALMPVCALLIFLVFLNPEAVNPFGTLPRFFSAAILIVFIYMAVQAIFISPNRAAAGAEFLKWCAAGAGFLLFQNFSRGRLRYFFYVFVALGAIQCLYGFYELQRPAEQVLWRVKTHHLGYLTGTYLNRNHLAGLLELSLGIQCGLMLHFFRRNKMLQLLLLCPVFCLCGFGLLKTGSRMGVACFAVALTLFTAMLVIRREKGAGTMLFFVCLVLAFMGMFGAQALTGRWEEYRMAASGFWGGRLAAWQDGLSMIRDHFWLGTGLGNFEWIFPVYQSPGLQWSWTHLHQDYLELLSGLGAPAFSVLVAGFFILFVSLLKKEVSSRDYPLFWGGMMGLVMMLMHGLTDFNFSIPANAMLWIFLLGMTWRLALLSEDAE